MTTKVTVDAHAGWPVLVTTMHGEPTQPKHVTIETVEPGTVRDFYIHSGLKVLHIEEQTRTKEEPAKAFGVPFGAVD